MWQVGPFMVHFAPYKSGRTNPPLSRHRRIGSPDDAAPNTPPDASAFLMRDPLMRAATARSRDSGHRVSAAERVTSSALMGLLLALAAARVADASLACDTC